MSCDPVDTEAPGHATALALARASQYDTVFTLGGDGTAMEVLTALADRGPPLGILAAGTGNVLARAFGIPLPVGRAVRALLDGREARIDLGRLQDGRHFAVGVGVGLDEAIIAGASQRLKQHVGLLAYVWSGTKAALRLRHFQVRLTVDGASYERQAAFALIANLGAVPFLGGTIRLGRGISYDDGVLHACIFSPAGVWDALRLFARFLLGSLPAEPTAFYVAGRHFRLETEPRLRAQADGELLDLTPLEITVRPLAGRLLIPAG